jgi:hypothetical protein
LQKYARPLDFVVLLVALAAAFFLFREVSVGAIPNRWIQLTVTVTMLVVVLARVMGRRRHQ